jgi:hypothetical protein
MPKMSSKDGDVKSKEKERHIIYLKLENDLYRRLRRKIINHERASGVRLSQQDVITAACQPIDIA